MRLVIITMVLLLAGCSSPQEGSLPYDALKQPSSLPKAGLAQIVLYYPSSFFWADKVANINLNGKRACGLKSGTFFTIDVAPGPRTAIVASLCGMIGSSHLTIATKAGKRYYVRITPTNDHTLTGLIAQSRLTAPEDVKAKPTSASDAPVVVTPFSIEVMDEAVAMAEMQPLKDCTRCF